jgi:hypothetical protein
MSRTIRALARRWPTLLAIGSATLNLSGDQSNQVALLGQVLLLLPLLYLVVAKTERRDLSWPLLIVSMVLLIGLRLVEVVPVTTVVVLIALGTLIWSAVGGQLLRPGQLRIQALGMLGFGALALLGLAVDPDLGRYLVAVGWFFHGVWDWVYLKLDKVVARSYAEWCGVVDILTAVQLLALG